MGSIGDVVVNTIVRMFTKSRREGDEVSQIAGRRQGEEGQAGRRQEDERQDRPELAVVSGGPQRSRIGEKAHSNP